MSGTAAIELVDGKPGRILDTEDDRSTLADSGIFPALVDADESETVNFVRGKISKHNADVRDINLMGKGAFSRVYRARIRRKKKAKLTNCIVRVYPNPEEFGGPKNLLLDARETIFKTTPGLLPSRYFLTKKVNGFVVWVEEFVEGYHLNEFLGSDETTLGATARLFLGLQRDINRLHKNQLLHLDIKCSNVRVRKNGQGQFVDIGAFNELGDGRNSIIVATQEFLAPEVINESVKPSEYSDYFAFGKMLTDCLVTAFDSTFHDGIKSHATRDLDKINQMLLNFNRMTAAHLRFQDLIDGLKNCQSPSLDKRRLGWSQTEQIFAKAQSSEIPLKRLFEGIGPRRFLTTSRPNIEHMTKKHAFNKAQLFPMLLLLVGILSAYMTAFDNNARNITFTVLLFVTAAICEFFFVLTQRSLKKD